MADQQETFSDVQPIQQKAAPEADASAPQETFSDVTPIAVSKTPTSPTPKSMLGQLSEAPGLTNEEKFVVSGARAARGAYHGIMGDEETPESRGETTTASPEAAELGFTPEHVGYKAGEMVHGVGKFGADVAKDVMGNTPIAVPNEQGVGISDPKAHTLLAKYITAPSQAERDASQNEMQKYFESQGPQAAGHAISAFLHGTLGEYVPLVGPLAMSLTDQATKGDIGGALAQLAALYGFEKGTGAVKEGIKGRVQDAVVNATKTPEIRKAEANVKALEADRTAAQAAYDKVLAEHNKHAASHAQGIQSPEKVVKELTKTQAALDEATAHHELAKEALARKVAAQPTIPQRIGTAAGKAAASVLPTPAPAPEVPTEAIEAQPSPLKPLGTPEPAPAVSSPINVKTPGQIQPETFPQTPTERQRTPLGRIELAGGQGTMGKPPLLTEGTPEGPQLPPGGLPQIKIPEAPKPAPQPAAVDEAALRALSAKEGKVVETPEKKVGRLLQEALKPTEKTKEATAPETKETPEEYKGEERRENARPTTMTPTEIEEAMKNRKPVHTPFDVTEGAMDTIKRDKDLPKSPAEEFSEKTAVPKSEPTGYKAKNEELVPTGAEGREAAKSAEEYHPAVEQKVNELSDENLKKLAKAHGLNPDEYDFNARDERRHRVERDQLTKDITEQIGEDEKINLGRAAESAEREPGFASRDTTAQSKAARAEKIFPRLRGPVDEYGNPKVSGGAPDTVGTAEGARSDTEHFANAKKELGDNASISDVAKRAQEMKEAAKATAKYANPEKGIPETSLAKGPEAEAMHAATVASDKLAEEWKTANEEKPKAEKTQTEAHNENGGSTFHLEKGDLSGTSHFAVGGEPEFKNTDLKMTTDGKNLTKEQLDEFKNRPAVKEALEKHKDASVGTWFDKDTGKTTTELVKTPTDRDEAVAMGQKNGEKAIYDLKKGEEIKTTNEKGSPVGKNNYHGEPLSYEHDNGDHKVVTTDKDGKKIGELLAKDSAPNTVEVVSNQVYDKDLRGKGRGVDQIQHLLEKVGDDIKSVKSDISTSKDARAAWDKLEKFAPEAVTKETFKDGQVQYSVDMEKWRGELGFREPHPTRTPVDEAVGFNPEQFHTQTDEPLTKLGEKRKKSPFGTIR